MTNPNWGTKRACPKCATRFYDLGKNPAKCPKCGVEHDVTVPVKTRRTRTKSAPPAAAIPDKAKVEAKKKIKKPVKEIEDIDLDEFEDIAVDSDEEIEEIDDDMEDIENLEELEEVEEVKEGEGLDDETAIEDKAATKGVLIDPVDDDENVEEDEEDAKAKRSASKQAAAKGKAGAKKKK